MLEPLGMIKMKYLIIGAFMLFILVPSYGQDLDIQHINRTSPELILEESDFTYEYFDERLQWLENVFADHYKKQDVGWEIENIGIPNGVIVLRGYGLFSRKEIISLKLDNARLKENDNAIIQDLEEQLKDSEAEVQKFLAQNRWHD